MELQDIRACYDIVDQEAAVHWHLQMRPPPSTSLGPCTGLGCLTFVLRNIYSHAMLGPQFLAQTAWFKNSESQNPLLAFAWLMFEEPRHGDEEAATRATETRAKLFKTLPMARDTFRDLCTSKLMNDTFWSLEPFRLFQDKVILSDDPGVPAKTVAWDPDEMVERSLIRLNLKEQPQNTLQDAVEGRFGIVDGCVTNFPDLPIIVRVLYEPGTSTNRLGFQALREFHLPQGDWLEDEQGFSWAHDTHRFRYALMAVVRMRHAPGEHDTVRIYKAHGQNIAPEIEPEAYTPGSWLLDEPSPHSFMLFYMFADTLVLDRDFPELSPPAVVLDQADAEAVNDTLNQVSKIQELSLSSDSVMQNPFEHRDMSPLILPPPQSMDPDPATTLDDPQPPANRASPLSPPQTMQSPKPQDPTQPQSRPLSVDHLPATSHDARVAADPDPIAPVKKRRHGKHARAHRNVQSAQTAPVVSSRTRVPLETTQTQEFLGSRAESQRPQFQNQGQQGNQRGQQRLQPDQERHRASSNRNRIGDRPARPRGHGTEGLDDRASRSRPSRESDHWEPTDDYRGRRPAPRGSGHHSQRSDLDRGRERTRDRGSGRIHGPERQQGGGNRK
ncbi:hypothetical protein FZEAL_7292 [Fusarium zealandicum]|uniref:Uncharacterized protein n=1 Tax=Fusarium zealandicum TaxID=1053134 RepID=A0A8H4XI02_9HYPO|nr:hypothetical protein FZEAL_7292 [Fusarium zealandicum]